MKEDTANMKDDSARKHCSNTETGSRFEKEAAAFLEKQGFCILTHNYRSRTGEIDLVARYRDTLVFCEVKYRRTADSGDPAAAVDYRKQQKIFQTALCYMKEKGIPEDTPCRFDVVAICGTGEHTEYRLITDAFGGF